MRTTYKDIQDIKDKLSQFDDDEFDLIVESFKGYIDHGVVDDRVKQVANISRYASYGKFARVNHTVNCVFSELAIRWGKRIRF